MTKANSLDPPKLATWLMEKLTPAPQNAPLAGDLVEAFRQGRSSSWYWRQVFWAVLIGLLHLFRKRWGRFAYVLVCGGLICVAWFSVFPMTGSYTGHQFSVTCCGHTWFSPVQVTGPSSAIPVVFALYANSYGIQWPWSLVYQIAFLTAFQVVIVASALGAYIGFARILKVRNFLRAMIVVVLVLVSSNVAATFLGVPPSDIRVSSYSISQLAWWVLVSTPAMLALLLGMWQTDLADNSSRSILA